MIATIARYGRLITLPASFVVTLVLSRHHGTEAVGQYTYLMSIIGLASLFSVFGTGQSMWAANFFQSPEESLRVNILITIATSIFVSGGLFIAWKLSILPPTWGPQLITICISSTFIAAINMCLKNYHLFRGRMDLSYTNDIALYALLIAGFSATCYFGHQDIPSVILLALLGTVIMFSAPYHIVTALTNRSPVSLAYLQSSAITMVGGFLGLMSYRIVYLVIGRIFDEASLGYFALVATTCDACILLISSMMIGDLRKIKDGHDEILRPLLRKQILLSASASLAIIIVGPQIISTAYNVDASQITGFIWPAGLSIILTVTYKYIQNILLLQNGTNAYFTSNFILLTAIFMALLIGHNTPIQVAWSSTLAQLFTTLFLFLRNRSLIGFHHAQN